MSRNFQFVLLLLFISISHFYSFETSKFYSCLTENRETTLSSHDEIYAIEEKLSESGKSFNSCKIHDVLVQFVWNISSAGENFNISCVIDKFRETVCSDYVSLPSADSFCTAKNIASGDIFSDTENDNSEKPKPLFVWLYAIGSVTVISVCSLLGIFILPLTKNSIYNTLLLFFLYLSVGTLTGNAVFHMLPKGFGNHNNIFSSAIVSIGIYSFYFLESLLENVFRSKVVTVDTKNFDKEEIGSCPNALKGSSSLDGNFEDYQECDMNSKKSCQHKASFFRYKQIKPIAWMITIADAMHNLIDGIAIGASFVISPVQGVTTSMAIFFEELPHELGDFAILLNAGMTFSQAAFFNFSSACFCYIGMAIGILLSLDVHNFDWIFALTGGVFIYIALAGMMPEAKEHAKLPQLASRPWFCFVVQNCGLLFGFVSMFLLARYEDVFHV